MSAAANLPQRDHQSSPQPVPCKCKPSVTGKNLVICIDGTSNQFNEKNTNVIELYNRLVKNPNQLTYYNSGIGTYATPFSYRSFFQWLSNGVDLAIAWNFEKTVMSAYRWLTLNYENGDRIFLFGFSRGAYQVRALAGMIDKVGLIYKGNDEQIPFAYELYADQTSDSTTSSKCKRFLGGIWPFHLLWNSNQKRVDLAKRFKETFSRENVRVHFIGAWDTVSSVGVIRHKNLPGTISQDHICFFRHALALDELRVKFLPEYACGGVMIKKKSGGESEPASSENLQPAVGKVGKPSDANVQANSENLRPAVGKVEKPSDANVQGAPKHPKPADIKNKVHEESKGKNKQDTPDKSSLPHIKEVWFPGTHSDIGGGIAVNGDLDRRHPSFLWMAYEATSADLKMSFPIGNTVEWKWEELGETNKSLTWCWRPLEYLPLKQLSYEPEAPESYTRIPHCGRGRKIQPGQMVHASIAFCPNTYRPESSLPVGDTQRKWEGLVGRGQKNGTEWARGWTDLLEMDIFDVSTAHQVVKEIASKSEGPLMAVHRLTVMSWSDQGCGTLREVNLAAKRLIDAVLKWKEFELGIAVANAIIKFVDDSDQSGLESLSDLLHKANESFLKLFIYDPSAKKFNMMCRWANDAGLRKKMMDSGVAVLLSELDDDLDVHQSALNLVGTLVVHSDSRPKLLGSNIMKALLTGFEKENENVYRSALDCMGKFESYNDSYQKILDSDIVLVLLPKLKHPSPRVHQSALDWIEKLVEYEDLRQRMMDSNIIGTLLSNLGNTDWRVCLCTLDLMRKLVEYDDSYQKLLNPNILRVLLSKLEDENWEISYLALDLIKKLIAHDEFRSKMLNSNTIQALLSKLKHKDEDVRQSVIKCITELLAYDDLHQNMLDSEIIVALLPRLGDEDDDVCQSTLNCITKLATHNVLHQKLSDSNIVAALLTPLTRPSKCIRQSAFKCAMDLAKHDDLRQKMRLDSDIVTALTRIQQESPEFANISHWWTDTRQ